MAELTFKSPGVSTKEIDLSGPTALTPTGVPAGIIGTANQGPAFVPVTVATFADFMTYFGKTDGEKFGPLAMYEWMKNANAGTYLRVLGAGDGKKRLSSNGSDADSENVPAGGVTNAGWTVGSRQVRDSTGLVNENAYSLSGGALGRTYFLGAFMSESNGSRFLSDAGIQSSVITTEASATTTALGGGAATVTVNWRPPGSQGTGKTVKLQVEGTAEWGEGNFSVLIDADGADVRIVWRLNTDQVDYGSVDDLVEFINTGTVSRFTGTLSVTDDSSLLTKLSATKSVASTLVLLDADDQTLTLAGGTDGNHAQPIVRGLILAASGVIPTLSGNLTPNASTASYKNPMREGIATNFAAGHIGGAPNGAVTCGGASAVDTYNFRMLLNGHKATDQYPNEIVASLNPEKANYLSAVFNTDPTKLQQAGHVLYSHFDVTTAQAVITGSNVGYGVDFRAGTNMEEVAFLVTSSIARNKNDSGSTNVPNFENFNDRFRHAFSPTVCSQKLGGKNKDLFTIHSLDAGSFTNTNIKVSIENIRKSKIDDDYGSFDLIVRKFTDSDEAPSVIETGESFRGLNLNPTSNDYIGRRIGTINKYYDFDKLEASQKITVDGVHPSKSRYIRVSMASEVDSAEMAKTALPIAFRGPYHLVTSGSSIFNTFNVPLADTTAGRKAGTFFSSGTYGGIMGQITEPPVPYRTSIADGTGGKKKPNSSYYWGLQTTKVTSATQPNASKIFNKGISAHTKYYPMFSTARQAPWAGANPGATDSEGTVYDCDKFNNNLFSLENIQIHTKSTSDIVDFREWGYAQYRRNGTLLVASDFPNKGGSTGEQGRFLNVKKDFGDIASFKYFKFTMPVQGGFDGLNVFDKDKFKMDDTACKREMDDSTQGQTSGPTVSAYMKALHIMSEKSDVDIQLLAVPGIRETKITNEGIAKTEERFDALYIMDIEERDVDNNVVTSSNQEISVSNTVEDLRGRALDTSFAACYFPDTIIPDPTTLTNVRVPPSVSVLGAMSLNDSVAFPWFAPAGFTRGSLSNVFDTTVNFNRANLDALYETDINPITQFPGQPDHVIFGQKTLQAAASALDRVNVRRLLIDVRRKVRQVADTFIFEPNRADTLARFSAAVNPILAAVQAQQGVERYRVIIDTTTTTQADVENNTVRGKIFMQPTRAVEFIALDFVVTNNGTEI